MVTGGGDVREGKTFTLPARPAVVRVQDDADARMIQVAPTMSAEVAEAVEGNQTLVRSLGGCLRSGSAMPAIGMVVTRIMRLFQGYGILIRDNPCFSAYSCRRMNCRQASSAAAFVPRQVRLTWGA